MLVVNADESEKSVPRFPLKIGGSGGAHNISWMPVCLRHLVWSFWFTAGDHYTSWFMPVERSLSPIMVMPNLHFGPVCHSYLFPYFWTFWTIMGCSRPASGEWSWDLKQLTVVLGAARCITEGRRNTNTARYIAGRRRNSDRSGQTLALENWVMARRFANQR